MAKCDSVPTKLSNSSISVCTKPNTKEGEEPNTKHPYWLTYQRKRHQLSLMASELVIGIVVVRPHHRSTSPPTRPTMPFYRHALSVTACYLLSSLDLFVSMFGRRSCLSLLLKESHHGCASTSTEVNRQHPSMANQVAARWN